MNPGRMAGLDLAPRIDHTNLLAGATSNDIEKLCREAVQYGFHAVCVHPGRVALAAGRLAETGVRVCTVAAFPSGASPVSVTVAEAEAAIALGATEVDMVLDIGRLRDGACDEVSRGIAAVADAVHARGPNLLKVILETGLLDAWQIESGCRAALEGGADFVKTSTGFGPRGATIADVRRLRAAVGDEMGVKAAGGIRDTAAARALVEAGATRLGTSASVAIVTGTG